MEQIITSICANRANAGTLEDMILLIALAVLAFFPLALAFGRDSRPHDSRSRRWL
jgi:hypothetical protein